MGWSDDAAKNRATWTKSNAEYTDARARDAGAVVDGRARHGRVARGPERQRAERQRRAKDRQHKRIFGRSRARMVFPQVPMLDHGTIPALFPTMDSGA